MRERGLAEFAAMRHRAAALILQDPDIRKIVESWGTEMDLQLRRCDKTKPLKIAALLANAGQLQTVLTAQFLDSVNENKAELGPEVYKILTC